ncbi:GntR family transcriptional regulator [Paracoccus laeviglucosivorans]|uniref:DNA-binding transcriptional regulator, GntR family n=1 Tax=Paracoccus laeviglucosivorans TaxID=1197861 RepID=A0A521FQG8_9RHOB|nr:GntR family transcriptional regulator [Paracoccus laeviglucosivorans]SMO98438.1 DNA-binding transcriptional regulator, GntR family [Paracoccus laeviglucosivorans]
MARVSLSPQIMAQIVEHARSQNMLAGQHLPAQLLADNFRVSRQPIVSALKKLEEMGIVESAPNRGYFLTCNADEIPEMDNDAAKDDEVYFAIASDRLAGRLHDRLSENELMRLYGITRGRLLRVLHQISDEGWVERLPGNGWEFREILTSRKAYFDAYQFRASIEMQALLLPSFQIDEAAFTDARRHQQELLASYESENRKKIFGTNVEFHEMLMTCANNDFFLDAVRRVNRVRRLMEYSIASDRSRMPQQCREHLQILELIEQRDMQAASTFLYRHIREACRIKAALIA